MARGGLSGTSLQWGGGVAATGAGGTVKPCRVRSPLEALPSVIEKLKTQCRRPSIPRGQARAAPMRLVGPCCSYVWSGRLTSPRTVGRRQRPETTPRGDPGPELSAGWRLSCQGRLRASLRVVASHLPRPRAGARRRGPATAGAGTLKYQGAPWRVAGAHQDRVRYQVEDRTVAAQLPAATGSVSRSSLRKRTHRALKRQLGCVELTHIIDTYLVDGNVSQSAARRYETPFAGLDEHRGTGARQLGAGRSRHLTCAAPSPWLDTDQIERDGAFLT